MKKLEILKIKNKAMQGWIEKLQGKNKSEICRKAGISRGTLYNILNDVHVPKDSIINAINEILDKRE